MQKNGLARIEIKEVQQRITATPVYIKKIPA
jgi:hypothetical protein